ncbi:MAG TPA: DUF86 domain-containing protein [Syntrophothermus lipocalidus]|nr:DUF86 domain-containing protein [Syntrophothermus lipocalidus]
MVDKILLHEKLKLLVEYISDLQEQKNISLSDLETNKQLRRYIERTLHLAVEACLDIGSHIIADSFSPTSTSQQPMPGSDVRIGRFST